MSVPLAVTKFFQCICFNFSGIYVYTCLMQPFSISTSDVFILVCLTYWHWCVIFASVYLPLVCCMHEWYTNMPCIYVIYMYIGTNCVQNCSFGTCWSTVHENFQNLWPESATEWTSSSIFSQHNGKSVFICVCQNVWMCRP